MSSAHASPFACGDEDAPLAPPKPQPAPRVRRSTSGQAPPPAVRWQAPAQAEEAPDYSDDEDYLHGSAVVKRQVEEERKRSHSEISCICDDLPRAGCPVHGARGNSRSFLHSLEVGRDSEEESEDEEDWSAEMPEPLPQSILAPQVKPAAAPAPAPSALPAPPVVASHASELMGSAVREAFLSGIEQGKRMQLPMQCKTCAVRKERNRVAAKESRQKKRREAEIAVFQGKVDRAADVAASRAFSIAVTQAATSAAVMAAMVGASGGAGAGVGAGAGAGAQEEEELVPPPF